MAYSGSKPEALVGLFNLTSLPLGPETSETVSRIQDTLANLETLCRKNDSYSVASFLNQAYWADGRTPRYSVYIVFLTTPLCVRDLDEIYKALFSQPLTRERYLLAVSDDLTLRDMARAITLEKRTFPENWILYTPDLEMYLAIEVLPKIRPSDDAFAKQWEGLTAADIEGGVDIKID